MLGIILFEAMSPTFPFRRRHLCRNIMMLATAAAFSTALSAQSAKPDKAERREMKGETSRASGDKPTAEDAQSRGLAKLREQFEVADDAEWEVMAGRIVRVSELRRSLSGGSASTRGSPALGEKSKRTGRSDASAHPEQDALRTAVRDKLPDAEIKARLARVHDVHRQNEAKLAKAQEELRAILTMRQEAIAVMAGLLPP